MDPANRHQLFNSLYEQYRETVYKYVLVSLDFNANLADDCMQDILTLLYQKTEVLSAHPNPGGFCIVTARNFIKKYKTALFRASRLTPLDENEPALRYEVDIDSIFADTADIDALKQEILRQLDAKDTALYEMFYEQGCPVADIAKNLSITENNVKVRLFRLRFKVKTKIKQMFA